MTVEATIIVPGTMFAHIEDGKIVNYTFSPSASDAGYFGEEIVVFEGDDINSEEFFDLVSKSLSITKDQKSAMFACEWAS